MSVSTENSPSNPQDTARLVLEMNNENKSTATNIVNNNNNKENSNNNDRIDPNLMEPQTQNKDNDGDEIMTMDNQNSVDTKETEKNSTSNEEISTKNTDTTEENKHLSSNDEVEKRKIFYTNLQKLTSNIERSLFEINMLLPSIKHQNKLFYQYSEDLILSNSFKTYDEFLSSNNKNNINIHHKSKIIANKDNSNVDGTENPTDNSYFETNGLPLIPGTDIPEVDLNNQAKTVRDIWEEWTVGHKNSPALKILEKKYGTRWRRGRIAKSAQRRKKVIEFIENEFKRHNTVLPNIVNVVNDLENYRIHKGKGLFWLYGALPDRLYDDAGRALFKNENENENENLSNNNNNNDDDLNKENPVTINPENKIEEGNVANAESNPATSEQSNDSEPKEKAYAESTDLNNNKEKEGKEQQLSTIDDDKIDDDLKAVDSTSNDNDIASSKDSKKSNEHQSTKLNKTAEDEEILDEDEEDDDVDMPSVADVAAMAAMSVEGEDDEHALVNSAALAVAAQHVADQQRLRDRQKSSGKENDNEGESDLNNYLSTEDGLNENTDPALSKL